MTDYGSRTGSALVRSPSPRPLKAAVTGALSAPVYAPRPPAHPIAAIWSSTGWAIAVSYVVNSPNIPPLPQVVRVVVTVAALAAAFVRAVLLTRSQPGKRLRFDMTAALLVVFVVVQELSDFANGQPVSPVKPLLPCALLLLALASRAETGSNPRAVRIQAEQAAVLPLSFLLLANLVVGYGLPGGRATAAVGSLDGGRIQGLADSPNQMGLLAVVVGLIAFATADSWRSWALACLAIGTLVASDSRTALVAAVVAWSAAWTFRPARRRWWRLGLVLAAASGLPVLINHVILVRRTATSNILSSRNYIWSIAEKLSDQGGPLGLGPRTIARLLGGSFTASIAVFHAHDQWLEDLVNFGWPGLVATAVLCAFLAWRSRRFWEAPLGLLTLVAVLVDGITEAPLTVWGGVLDVLPLVMVVWFSPRQTRTRIPGRRG